MKPLHIGILSEEYPPSPHGGTGSIYRDLCEGLVEAGHRATVVSCHPRLELKSTVHEVIRGVQIYRIPIFRGRWPYKCRQLVERWRVRRQLRRVHAEDPLSLVESSDYNGWLSGGPGAPVPTVVRIHGSNLLYDAELRRPPARFDIRHEIAGLRRANHLAALSRYAGERTLELAGLHRPCTPIYCGVDTEYFSPDPSVPVENGLIVFVNMINRRKGIEELIDAVNEVFPTRPHARLVAIGADKERTSGKPFLEMLKERVRPELRSRVEFPGRLPRESVRDWLRRAQIGCYPSHIETFGIAPVEAMAVGKAVIYSRRGPGPEVITDGETGLLCDPSQPGEIAAALSRLLDDPALCRRLGEAARAAVLERFDKRPWIQRNVEFFEECLARG